MAKAKSAKQRPIETLGETMNPHSRKHGLVVVENVQITSGKGMVRHERRFEAPLDQYFMKGQLGKDKGTARRRYEAGDRLRSDMHAAGLTPRVTVDLMRTGVGEPTYGMASSMKQVALRQGLREAASLIGNDRFKRLVMICFDEAKVEILGLTEGFGVRAAFGAGMMRFQTDLDELADAFENGRRKSRHKASRTG